MDSDYDDVFQEVADMTITESDARGQTVEIGTCQFPAPVSVD